MCLIDPAILAAVDETESAADRRCRQAPGSGILRQTQVRLDEASFDAAAPGRTVMLRRLRPFGLLEWTWPVDAPLLPMLPRPRLSSDGPRIAVPAQVTAITVDTRGRGLLTARIDCDARYLGRDRNSRPVAAEPRAGKHRQQGSRSAQSIQEPERPQPP